MTQSKRKKIGRPSSFSHEIAAKIFKAMGEGKSLRKACSQPGMPDMCTVLRWMRDNEDFSKQYATARENMLEYWANEIKDISDAPLIGVTVKEIIDKEGAKAVEKIHADMLKHRQLQIDTRKWLLSKLAPKKYGDRATFALSTPEGPLVTAALNLPATATAEEAAQAYEVLIRGEST